jgi:ParB-like nuclease domain
LQNVPLAAISPNPNNPRKHFDQIGLKELADSIKVHGVCQPNQADYNCAVSEESPRRRIRKIREENQRKLRELRVQLGVNLLKSRAVALPEAQTDRERIALIEAYKYLIRDKTRELESWFQHRDRAAQQGMTNQAQFRQRMIIAMENQVERSAATIHSGLILERFHLTSSQTEGPERHSLGLVPP